MRAIGISLSEACARPNIAITAAVARNHACPPSALWLSRRIKSNA